MPLLRDERNRILSMIEADQIDAIQAAQLLDALETESAPVPASGRTRERTLRIRITAQGAQRKKTHFNVNIPVQIIRLSLRMGGRILPQLNSEALEEVLRLTESRAAGQLLDLQDLERGERIEIFVE